MTVYEPPSTVSPSLSVRSLLGDAGLDLAVTLLAGASGLDRHVQHRRIQKSGLALAGHLHGIVPGRVQILGETELSYLEALEPDARQRGAACLFSAGLCCVFVTRGVAPPVELLEAAAATDTPLVLCQERSSTTITQLHALLDERLAPRSRVHGVLVDVFEVGVLILGTSGIGKSECAMELVMRGHRLVADDVVECDYRPPGMIFGAPNDRLRHHMEVRGLGILDIKQLYGVTAIRERKRIDLVAKLELWDAEPRSYDRLGLEERTREILGVPLRELRLPVRPGRNISSIIEIAARHELLRQAGHDSARSFVERIESSMASATGDQPEVDVGAQPRVDVESSVPPPVAPRETAGPPRPRRGAS